MGTGFVIVCLITGVFWAREHMMTRDTITVLARNPPGKGDSEVQLNAYIEETSYPVDIQIKERMYTEDELEEVFKKGKEWLDSVWLGENTEAEYVTSDLYFPTYIDEFGLTVRWEVENYVWIQSDGKITERGLLEEPQSINICAVLSYGETEKVYTYEVNIGKTETTKDKHMKKEITDALNMLNDENLTKEEIYLPTSLNGEQMLWYVKQPVMWPKIFLFGNVIIVLIYFAKEERKMQKIKDREKMLELDYPDIVYRMVLLIGAGMTIKNAWEKMTEEYEREKITTGRIRWGYEEMETTLREMNFGIAEIKAYENFGNRCGNQNYIRLSALLIQQVKRGAKGMNQLLMQEVTESEILWRENSKKRAEEAGIKLLFPMILLMTVVFAVLMIPAFLSMSIG